MSNILLNNTLLLSTLASLWICIVLALSSSSIAFTISQSKIFQPVRLLAKSIHHSLGELFQCFYCLNHWFVITGVLIYQPVLLHSNYIILDLLVSTFFTITLSTLFSGKLFNVFKLSIEKRLKEIALHRVISNKEKNVK